tara:strand:+ start:136 stop:681 length:546 start_codon:yes stop_codon:yes gene_type:complete
MEINMQKSIQLSLFLGLLLSFGCASKKHPTFYPKFVAQSPLNFEKDKSPLLVHIEDRRGQRNEPPQKEMILKLKNSLKGIYGKKIEWVELDNAVPLRVYADVFITSLKSSFKSPYWKAKSSVYIRFVDRREALKEVVKETTFKGAHQKVNVPWENTKGIVLKKAWEKVSFDVLKSLNTFVQ